MSLEKPVYEDWLSSYNKNQHIILKLIIIPINTYEVFLKKKKRFPWNYNKQKYKCIKFCWRRFRLFFPVFLKIWVEEDAFVLIAKYFFNRKTTFLSKAKNVPKKLAGREICLNHTTINISHFTNIFVDKTKSFELSRIEKKL